MKLLDGAAVPAFFVALYSYAWFVGFGIAFVVYITLRTLIAASAARLTEPLST